MLRRSTLAVLLLVAIGARPNNNSVQAKPSRYLYVWAGAGHDSTKGVDMMTVLDADPASKTYGAVLSALTVDSSGLMPHHTEYVLPAKGPLFANDYTGNKSFLIDFSNPLKPRLSARLAGVPGGRMVHTFIRLPDGNVLVTYQFGDSTVAGNPGGIAVFDSHGRLLRQGSSRDAAFPGARIRTYGLAALPASDRAITTSSPMDNEKTANVVQIWRLSDVTLLKTLAVPVVQGDSAERYPFEIRPLADGSVLLNSYACGFYRLTDIATNPQITRVLALPEPKNFGCSVPLLTGHFWIMPIAYAHRFATIDISDPTHPVEVASFPTDTTFFPHWIAADPGSDRVVFTDQGDGAPMVMVAHLDSKTGHLSWDEAFRDAGAAKRGVSYNRPSWPNGLKGMAMPHGALFVP
jgi:hypothetical protein